MEVRQSGKMEGAITSNIHRIWEVKVRLYSKALLLQIYDNLIMRLMIKSYLVGVGFLLNDDDIVLTENTKLW